MTNGNKWYKITKNFLIKEQNVFIFYIIFFYIFFSQKNYFRNTIQNNYKKNIKLVIIFVERIQYINFQSRIILKDLNIITVKLVAKNKEIVFVISAPIIILSTYIYI